MKNGDSALVTMIQSSPVPSDAKIAADLGMGSDLGPSNAGTLLEHECDDEVLMQRVQARQPNALKCLHARYRAIVMHVAVGILPALADAQEVGQDGFFELWNRADNIAPRREKLRGWIGALTHRRAIDRHRKVRKRITRHEAIRQELERAEWEFGNSGNAVLYFEASMMDERDILLGIVDALPPEQVQVVLLTYYMEMSQREVARHLRITLGTVKHRLTLAMRALSSHSAELRAKLSLDH